MAAVGPHVRHAVAIDADIVEADIRWQICAGHRKDSGLDFDSGQVLVASGSARQVELVQNLGVGHDQLYWSVLFVDLAAREQRHAEKRQRDHSNDPLPTPHTAPPTLRFRLTIHLRKSSRSAA